MQLALKIDVDSYRGALYGVPRLVDILRRHHANASFCFALGPDQGGRLHLGRGAPGGIAVHGGPGAHARLGLRSLCYGTVLPGPEIGKRCRDILKATGDGGFETAVHGWNVAAWSRHAARADATWSEIQMRRAHERYIALFGSPAAGHAAPLWQMNPQALRLTQRLGYQWASDTRGTTPFLPVWKGEPVRCVQLPTTLPGFDELIGSEGVDEENVHAAVLQHSAALRDMHVLTLCAERGGIHLAKSLELLLTGLREQGYALVSLGQLRARLDLASLPRHEVDMAPVAGRAGTLLCQGREFLA